MHEIPFGPLKGLRSYLKGRDAHLNMDVGVGQRLIFICDHDLGVWEESVL